MPVIDIEHTAISGTVHITITPNGESTDWGEYPANIQIELQDVCFANAQQEVSICVEGYTAETFIGWMPG
jgi:hypothetical protein